MIFRGMLTGITINAHQMLYQIFCFSCGKILTPQISVLTPFVLSHALLPVHVVSPFPSYTAHVAVRF